MNERTRPPSSEGSTTTVRPSGSSARAGVKDGLRGMGFDAQVQMLTPSRGTSAGKAGATAAGAGGVDNSGGVGTPSPGGTLQHAVETDPSFFDRLFQRTVAGIETINKAIAASDPDALLESFLQTVGTTVTDFMSADPMGRLTLQFMHWSDELLQGHGTAKFGKAEYGDTGGKHVDEDDGVMAVDPNATNVDFSHDALPSLGGGGGFEGAGEKKSLKDFLEDMQTLYDDIDEALELAEKLGLLEESESSEESGETAGGDKGPGTTTTTSSDTKASTTTDKTKLVDAKEDGSGNLTPSNGGGQFAVKGDGKVDNAPNLGDADATKSNANGTPTNKAGDKLGGVTSETKRSPGGSGGGLPKLSLKDVAQSGEWQPLNLDYQASARLFEHTDDKDWQHLNEARLDYWVWIATYPHGDYDIVATYTFTPAGDGAFQSGSKLIERRKAGTPKPGGA